MGQIKKLYQDSGNVETIVSTEELAVYPITASTATYHPSVWGNLGADQSVGSILGALNEGYQYVGLATPSTNPGTYTHKVFYIAGESGTYTNFNNIEVSGLTILKTSGSGWSADSVGISGGGGGGGTGYIGSTQVRDSSTTGVYDLTGLKDASFSGNLSVTGTSTLTGNVTIGGTVFLPATGKIVFGSNASTDPFIEYSVSDTQFHFNKGLYSDHEVTAGGVGSGGGGGGGATSLSGLNDVNNSLSPSAGQVLYYDNTLSPAKWNAHTLTYSDISDFPSVSTTSGFLKYTYSNGAGSWSLENGTVNLTNVMGQASGRTRVVTINGTDVYAPDATYLTQLQDVNVTESVSVDGYVLTYDHNNGDGRYILTPKGSGSDSWRPIAVNGITKLSSTPSSPATALNFEAEGNASVSYNNGTITIGASGGGTTVSWESSQSGVDSPNTARLKVGSTTKVVCLDGYSSGGSPANVGTLNTTATTGQSTSSSESFGGSITLHKVSKTGSYTDLLNTPTIPAAQVQSDWNATTGMGVILNKPNIPSAPGTLNTTATTAQSTSASEALSGSITLHKVAKTGTFSDLIGAPDMSRYMDLTTNQTVTSGLKTFTDGVAIGASGHTITWDSTNGFTFNGNVRVTGNIVATGEITAGA